MTLSQQHRSTIYQHLVPLFGADEAEAFMAEFPATENDELVTKQFLRAELAELRGEMAQLGGDLRTEMAHLGGELRSEMAELRGDLYTEMQRLNNRTLVALVPALIAGMGLAAAIG